MPDAPAHAPDADAPDDDPAVAWRVPDGRSTVVDATDTPWLFTTPEEVAAFTAAARDATTADAIMALVDQVRFRGRRAVPLGLPALHRADSYRLYAILAREVPAWPWAELVEQLTLPLFAYAMVRDLPTLTPEFLAAYDAALVGPYDNPAPLSEDFDIPTLEALRDRGRLFALPRTWRAVLERAVEDRFVRADRAMPVVRLLATTRETPTAWLLALAQDGVVDGAPSKRPASFPFAALFAHPNADVAVRRALIMGAYEESERALAALQSPLVRDDAVLLAWALGPTGRRRFGIANLVAVALHAPEALRFSVLEAALRQKRPDGAAIQAIAASLPDAALGALEPKQVRGLLTGDAVSRETAIALLARLGQPAAVAPEAPRPAGRHP